MATVTIASTGTVTKPPCFEVNTERTYCFEIDTYIQPCFAVSTEFDEEPVEEPTVDGVVEQLKTFGINLIWDMHYNNGSLYVSGMMNATPALSLRDQYAYIWRFSVWTGLHGGIMQVNSIQFSKRVVDDILGLNPALEADRALALGGTIEAYGNGNDIVYFSFKGKVLNTSLSPQLGLTSSQKKGWVLPNSQYAITMDNTQIPNDTCGTNVLENYYRKKGYVDIVTGLDTPIYAWTGGQQSNMLLLPDDRTFYGYTNIWNWITKFNIGGEEFDVYLVKANSSYPQKHTLFLVRGGEHNTEYKMVNNTLGNFCSYVQNVGDDICVEIPNIAYDAQLTELFTCENDAYVVIGGIMYHFSRDEETGNVGGLVLGAKTTSGYAGSGSSFIATFAEGYYLEVTLWAENEWQQDAEGYWYLSTVAQRSTKML